MSRSDPAPGTERSLWDAGGGLFLATAFAARTPPAMVQMGLLMILVSAGHSAALGGSAVAAVGLGSAIGAPLIGRANDRFGPARVTTICLVVQLLGLLGCLTALAGSWSPFVILALGAVIGAANPQIGAIARARWSRLARRHLDPTLASRAMGYEGAVDEIAFIIGPATASILVGAWGPFGALWALIVWLVVAQGAFLAYLWSRPFGRLPARTDDAPPISPAGHIPVAVLAPVVATLCVGYMFGETQVALGALQSSLGRPSAAGVIYGSLGIGSSITSLLVPRLPRSFTLGQRLLVGGLVVTGSVFGLSGTSDVAASVAWCIAVGVGVGLILVSSYAMLEVVAPTERLTAMMTWLATAVVLGVSAGSFIGGRVVDASGPQSGFVGSIVAGLAVAAIGVVALRMKQRRRVSD